jgi:hypothetical protein
MWSRELFCKAGKRILLPATGQGAPVSATPRLVTRAAGEFSTSGDEIGDRNADVFDRELKSKQRDRAAWLMHESDPILDTVTENLLDRLQVSGFTPDHKSLCC